MFTCHRNTLVLINWEEDTSCYLLAAKAPRRSGLPVTCDAPARCTCHQPIRSADTFCGPAASEIATTVSLPGTERLPASWQTDARGACDVNSVISGGDISANHQLEARFRGGVGVWWAHLRTQFYKDVFLCFLNILSGFFFLLFCMKNIQTTPNTRKPEQPIIAQ